MDGRFEDRLPRVGVGYAECPFLGGWVAVCVF